MLFYLQSRGSTTTTMIYLQSRVSYSTYSVYSLLQKYYY